MLTAAVAALVLLLSACAESGQVTPVSRENFLLDTVCRISVYEINGGLDEKEANAAIDRAYERCAALEKILSATLEVSDISRINSAGGDWVEVKPETVEVIRSGIKYGEMSDGAFDITIGGVTSLWDFHVEEGEEGVVPKADEIAAALTHVDYRRVEIDEAGSRVRISDPEARIDLGGIAKGYISAELADVLRGEGVSSAIVNLGGNIVAIGGKPGAESFSVGVEKPYSDRSELIGTIEAADNAVITSGVYERTFTANGKKYHHILSTETGFPVETDLDSVTLKADSDKATDLDALSTICLMKGSEAGKSFIEGIDGVEAIFCTSDGKITTTEGMDFTEDQTGS